MFTFRNVLKGITWNDMYLESDFETAFNMFYICFIATFEKCFPLKRIKINYKNKNVWLSNGLRKCIAYKNKLFHISKYVPTNINKYKIYRNILNMTIIDNGQYNENNEY